MAQMATLESMILDNQSTITTSFISNHFNLPPSTALTLLETLHKSTSSTPTYLTTTSSPTGGVTIKFSSKPSSTSNSSSVLYSLTPSSMKDVASSITQSLQTQSSTNVVTPQLSSISCPSIVRGSGTNQRVIALHPQNDAIGTGSSKGGTVDDAGGNGGSGGMSLKSNPFGLKRTVVSGDLFGGGKASSSSSSSSSAGEKDKEEGKKKSMFDTTKVGKKSIFGASSSSSSTSSSSSSTAVVKGKEKEKEKEKPAVKKKKKIIEDSDSDDDDINDEDAEKEEVEEVQKPNASKFKSSSTSSTASIKRKTPSSPAKVKAAAPKPATKAVNADDFVGDIDEDDEDAQDGKALSSSLRDAEKDKKIEDKEKREFAKKMVKEKKENDMDLEDDDDWGDEKKKNTMMKFVKPPTENANSNANANNSAVREDGKILRKKTVNKEVTEIDEKGYIHTTLVEEVVEEWVLPPKVLPPPPAIVKKDGKDGKGIFGAPKGGGKKEDSKPKQSGMMNFFGKKK